jgi:hypothetical protein
MNGTGKVGHLIDDAREQIFGKEAVSLRDVKRLKRVIRKTLPNIPLTD